MSENKREPGYYRVKTKDKKWIIAKWNGNYWWKVESIINRYDSDFSEIIETPIPAEPSNPEPQKSKLQTLMDDIRTWSDTTFGKENESLRIFYHLQKEVTELINAIKTSKEKTISTVLFEYVDCLMLLLNGASARGYTADDLLLALEEKLQLNKNRKWGNPDENGVIEHIRDGSKNPEPTREELVEKADRFFVGKSLFESLPELMADFYLEMKKNINKMKTMFAQMHQFKAKRIDNGEYVTGCYFIAPLTDENSREKSECGLFFLSGETRHCISTLEGVVFVIDPESLEFIELTKPQPTIIFPSEEEMEEIICGQSDGIWNNETTQKLFADGVSVKALAKEIIARIKELNQPNQ